MSTASALSRLTAHNQAITLLLSAINEQKTRHPVISLNFIRPWLDSFEVAGGFLNGQCSTCKFDILFPWVNMVEMFKELGNEPSTLDPRVKRFIATGRCDQCELSIREG